MKYDNYYFCMDTETGGLPSRLKKKATHEIALTEVAVVVVNNETLEIVEEKSWLIKPYKDDLIYDLEAAKVSGISLSMVQEKGENIEDVYRDIKSLCKKYKKGSKKPQMVGHNFIDFDVPFIEGLFEINKDDIYKYFDKKIWDTLEFARLKFIESSSFNLATTSHMCGLELVQAHRALPDTIITAKVWIKHLKCLRSGESEEQSEIYRETFEF